MSITSITKHKRDEFFKTAENRKTLFCEKISGFYLLKLSASKASWRLRYTAADKKRKTYTIGSYSLLPQKAAEIAQQLKTEINNGIYPDVTKAVNRKNAVTEITELEKTIGVYFYQVYTPFKVDYSPSGNETLKIIKNHFGHLFSRPILAVSNLDIINWYKEKLNQKLTRATLIRSYGAFKAMLNHACSAQDGNNPFIEHNPLEKVKLPTMTLAQKEEQDKGEQEQRKKRVMFSDEQKKSIQKGLYFYKQAIKEQRKNSIQRGKKYLPEIDDLTYPHWFFAYTDIARLTGMRMGDIYKLDWSNLEHNRFNNSTTLIFTPSKTNHKAGIIVKFPVTGELLEVFNTLCREQGDPTTGLILKSPKTGRAISSGSHDDHWDAVKKLGMVTPELQFTSFRHNFISELVQRGVPVLTIAGLVGHADGTMISKNYLRHDEHASAHILAILGNGWDQKEVKHG
jgi:integrase